MTGYDTTPTDDDMAYAREFINRGHTPLTRRELALDLIAARLEAITETDHPGDARLIAHARAYCQTYREDTYG